MRGVHPGRLWAELRASDYWWTIPSIALLLVAQAVRALRWQWLFPRATRPGYRAALEATLLGQMFNNLLPARAGEAARILWLHRRAGTSRVEAATTVVVERAFDVLALLALLFVLVPWLPHVTWVRAAAILAVILTAATVAIAAVLVRFGARPIEIALRPLACFVAAERVERASGSFARGAASLVSWRLAGIAAVLTVASWLLVAASAWLLLYGFDVPHSPLAGLLVTIATALSLILPSSPAAIGVFEAAALVALKAYDTPKPQALSYAIVLHAVGLFPYIAAGALVLLLHRTRLRS